MSTSETNQLPQSPLDGRQNSAPANAAAAAAVAAASAMSPQQHQHHHHTNNTTTTNNNPAPSHVAWAPQQSHVQSSMSSKSPRRRSVREQSATRQQQQPQQPPQHPSIPDRLAASALAGTLEVLKLAGGFTVHTTGKLVAPPLHITRTVVLPQLWAATLDHLKHITPRRIQDWFRIVSSSLQHMWTVLSDTSKGILFRHQLWTLWVNTIDNVSSDHSRQVLIDTVSTLVRFYEALNSPELHACLEQGTVTFCRVVDAMATAQSKQWLWDVCATWQAGTELLADPRTTVALAELTAYLCHALEMEHSHLYDDDNDKEKDVAQAQHDRTVRQQRVQRTYVDPLFVSDPHATVEQVILSSLGAATNDDDPTTGIPNEVVTRRDNNDNNDHHDEDDDNTVDWDAGSIRQQVDAGETSPEWHERARKGVNVALLDEKIAQRADRMQSQEHGRVARDTSTAPTTRKATHRMTSNDRDEDNETVEDVEEVAVVQTVHEGRASTSTPARPRTTLSVDTVENGDLPETVDWPEPVHLKRIEGESAVHHFHRILDEVLVQKRSDSLRWMVDQHDGETKKTAAPVEPSNKGHARLLGDETIKQRVTAFREELAKERIQKKREIILQRGTAGLLLVAAVLVMATIFVGFGCYGMYVFVYPPVRAVDRAEIARAMLRASPIAGPVASQEIVIRVIREVVHANKNGEVVGRVADRTILSQESIDKVTSCIAEAL